MRSAPVCAAAPFAAPPHRDWRHALKSRADVAVGKPNHRGRDLFINPGAPQTVIGKMACGVVDKDLEDGEVDVYVQRDCGTAWALLGTTITTGENGPHPNGDGTSTDLFLDVVPPKSPIFISDVDGTLTSSENIEFLKLLERELPDTHPGAPEAFRALAAKGYRPLYVTARPEWLVQRTRDFLDTHGFPPGIVHTSTSLVGAGFGSAAATFKTGELASLAQKGLVPATRTAPRTSSRPTTASSTRSAAHSRDGASTRTRSSCPDSKRYLARVIDQEPREAALRTMTLPTE